MVIGGERREGIEVEEDVVEQRGPVVGIVRDIGGRKPRLYAEVPGMDT